MTLVAKLFNSAVVRMYHTNGVLSLRSLQDDTVSIPGRVATTTTTNLDSVLLSRTHQEAPLVHSNEHTPFRPHMLKYITDIHVPRLAPRGVTQPLPEPTAAEVLPPAQVLPPQGCF